MMQDLQSIVCNAARDGKLRSLKIFLDRRAKDEVRMLIAAKTNGATPLVMACRNGHFDVAEYLVENCCADIEQPGSVVFDGETIEGAPPLWCAAAAGHLPVVRLLLRSGANVNSTTRTNSTPLRAACFDGHYEVVKFLVGQGADIEVANRHGHTCLMIACYKGHFRIAKFLLSLAAHVNRKSVKGNTALHDCAESGSLEILKLLIEYGGRMDVDSYGMTPLLAASVTGHTHIVEYLIKLPALVSRAERVDALELLGATYVDKRRDMIGALALWKRAMDDRYSIGSTHLPKPKQRHAVAAYDNTLEITNQEGLEELLADPDEMRMQALVIRERILGPAHPDTSYYIRYRGAVYADAGKFSRCIALWNYALDMQQSMLEPLNPMTQNSLLSFTELFSRMMCEQGQITVRGCQVPPVSFADLVVVFEKSVSELEAGMLMLEKIPAREQDATYLHNILVIALQLSTLLTTMLPDLSSEQGHEVYCLIYRLVKQDVQKHLGCTALHIVCCKDAALVGRYPCQFPSAHLAAALLTVGADVNARDDTGNTPLHLAAMTKPCPSEVVRILLDCGAHLDTVNSSGYSFSQLLQGQAVHEVVNPLKYTTLRCLAARIVVENKIKYEGIVPETLEEFVEEH